MRICKLGEDVLRQKCVSVESNEINDELRATLNEMFETMISADGVGLAAPQVGISKRFFVVISDDNVRRVFINPEIIKTSAENSEYEEGLKSFKYGKQQIGDCVYHQVAEFKNFVATSPVEQKWINELKLMGYDVSKLSYEIQS